MTQDKLAILSHIKCLKQEIMQEIMRRFETLEERVVALEDDEQQHAQAVQPIDDGWLTVAQVCKELHISDSTFYEWLNAGLLPEGVVFGPRSKRWKMSEIRAWREAKRDGNTVNIIINKPSKRRSRPSKIRKKEEFFSV